MSVWVTSDLHFNHKNILKYEKEARPFYSIQQMNQQLIDNWNSCVRDEDIVFVLGDFFMGKTEDVPRLLNQLKGMIYLITGNHDSNSKLKLYEDSDKVVVLGDYNVFYYDGHYIVMNHYPIAGDNTTRQLHLDCEGWKQATDFFKYRQFSSIYLYGHVHSAKVNEPWNSFHVGVDTNNLKPVLLDSIVDKWEEKLAFFK